MTHKTPLITELEGVGDEREWGGWIPSRSILFYSISFLSIVRMLHPITSCYVYWCTAQYLEWVCLLCCALWLQRDVWEFYVLSLGTNRALSSTVHYGTISIQSKLQCQSNMSRVCIIKWTILNWNHAVRKELKDCMLIVDGRSAREREGGEYEEGVAWAVCTPATM